MSENLDVLIAFVIVIAGLAMTLQLLTEILKGHFGIRWSVYEAFLRDLYHNYMGAASRGTPKKGDKESIQSVDQRFRAFAAKVEQLWSSLREIRVELVSIRIDLLAQVEDGSGNLRDRTLEEKTAILRAHLQSGISDLADAMERIEAVKPGKLLRIYQELFDSQLLGLKKEHRTALSDLGALVAMSVDETKQEVVDAVEESIKAILGWLRDIEQRAAKVHTSIQANMNDGLARLEDSYTRRLKKWTFWCGLVLCVLLNADSVTIFRSLRESSVLTSSVLQREEGYTTIASSSAWTAELNTLTQQAQVLTRRLREGEGKGAQKSFDVWNESVSEFRKVLAADAKVLGRHPGFKGSVELDLEGPANRAKSAKSLYEEEKFREAATAIDQATGGLATTLARLELTRIRLRLSFLVDSGLPLGWTVERLSELISAWWAIPYRILGILLTAVLISFGAPLWNDILKSLLGVKDLLRGQKKKAEA